MKKADRSKYKASSSARAAQLFSESASTRPAGTAFGFGGCGAFPTSITWHRPRARHRMPDSFHTLPNYLLKPPSHHAGTLGHGNCRSPQQAWPLQMQAVQGENLKAPSVSI